MQTNLDSKSKTRLRQRLLGWFDRHQRDLPWRSPQARRSPYRIWVSEVMLQQTQVATVVGYFSRFIKRFPNVRSLAAADESEVLKHWEGLGYYRRARQMHAASRKIVSAHRGRFPTDFETVLALPGIGRYTAGAILSISLGQRLPILEGNTIRLFSRLMGIQDDPRSSGNQAALWDFSASLLPRNRVGDFNQALMEVGALVCKVRAPACFSCPLSKFCIAFQTGQQHEIPAASQKMQYESVSEAVAVIERRSKILVRLCGSDERWAGLWDFPRFKLLGGRQQPPFSLEQITRQIDAELGLQVQLEPFGETIRHAVTKYRITLDSFQAVEVRGRLKTAKGQTMKWVSEEELQALPLSTTGRKIADRLAARNIS